MDKESKYKEKMQNKKQNLGMGILFAVLGAISWGISACFGQYLFENVPVDTNWVISIRLVLAGMIFVVISMVKDGKKSFELFKDKKMVVSFVFFSITGLFMSQYTFYITIEYSNAGTAAVMQSLATVMILVILCVKNKKIPTAKQVIAIVCTLAGVFLLSTGGDLTSIKISQVAFFSGLISAFGVVCYNVLSGDLIRKYGVYAVAGFGMLISGLLFLPIARPWETAVAISPEMVIGMFGIVVIGTAIAFGCFLKGVSIVGPLLGGLIGTLEPVSAVVISAIWLGEIFVATDIVAFVLIIGTVLWLSVSGSEKSKTQDGEILCNREKQNAVVQDVQTNKSDKLKTI